MQGQSRLYKIAGFIIAILGLRLFTLQKVVGNTVKPSFGWWGIIGGIVLLGLGWGIYDVGRNISRHQKAAARELDGKK